MKIRTFKISSLARYLVFSRRNHFIFGLLVFVVSISSVTKIFAQYRFDSWTTDNGLPQASVTSILQTRDGFLWLTTFGGLVRYDGARFQVFNSGNAKNLKTSRFLSLFETRNGDLWIAIESSGLVRYRDGIFTTYGTGEGLPEDQIERMSENPDGEFLVECSGRTFILKDEEFSEYKPANNSPTKSILQRMPDGAVWSMVGSRLQKFENGRVTFDYETESPIRRIFEDSKGRVWLAEGGENRLSMLKDGRLTTYTEKDGYAEFRFITAYEDRQGALWFGTNDGLIRFQNNAFAHFRMADGLASDNVNNIFQDREGTIWVGTNGGLNRLTKRAVTTYSASDGLAADNIYAIYQDRAERIWLGSWQGLTVYQNGRFENVSEKFKVPTANVTAMHEDSAGNFWIGEWAGVVNRFKNGEVTNILPAASNASVKIIYEDSEKNIWIGTSRGLIKLESETRAEFPFEKELSGKQILSLKEDRRGRFWIGTNDGLFKFENGKLKAFSEADGIANKNIRAIFEDADGALWFGTYDNGLYRFKENGFAHMTTNEGLFDNGAFQIVEDASGNFWISCNIGIYRIKKSELNDFADGRISKVVSIPYNKRDGMLNAECNGGASPAGIRAADGSLWFPTQKGAAVIRPDAIPFNSQPPPVVVEAILVDTELLDLKKAVEIRPDQTNLEIQYAGLSFINPELLKFKYKLENLDEDWIDAAGRRTAFYSHLPPGNYVFRVIAANRDGVWNETGASFEIKVIAPFWRTLWFYALISIFVIVVVVLIFRLRERELQRRQRVQEEFSRKLLESQESERKRIASEMHDSLGQYLLAIKNWALFGLNSLPKENAAREYLTEVSDTTAIALEEVREIAHNLRPYQLERLGLTNTLEYMLKNLKTPIAISSEIENIDDALTKDGEIFFYRIVQESINNVIKHSNAKNLHISIGRNERLLKFVCRDDGRGFDFAAAKNSPDSGLGLNGIAERVKILGGDYEVVSETGKGAEVRVTIPVGQEKELLSTDKHG